MHRLVHLKVGLALVLIRVGIKMLLKIDVLCIPTSISLAVVATILTVSVLTSLRATRGAGRRALPAPPVPPFRTASDAETAALGPLWGRRYSSARRRVREFHSDADPAPRGAGDDGRSGSRDGHDRQHEGEAR